MSVFEGGYKSHQYAQPWNKANVQEWLRMTVSMAQSELSVCAVPRTIARLRELLTDTDRMLRELHTVSEATLRLPVMDDDQTPWGVAVMAAAEHNMATIRGGMVARLLQYPGHPSVPVRNVQTPLCQAPQPTSAESCAAKREAVGPLSSGTSAEFQKVGEADSEAVSLLEDIANLELRIKKARLEQELAIAMGYKPRDERGMGGGVDAVNGKEAAKRLKRQYGESIQKSWAFAKAC